MKDNFERWLGWLFLIVITIEAFLWIGSHALLTEQDKSRLKQRLKIYGWQWLRFCLLTVLFSVILYFLFIIMIKAAFFNDPDQEHLFTRIKIALSIAGAVYYLLLTFVAQLNNTSWKKFFKKSISTALAKIYYSLPLFIILSTILYASAIGLGYVIEQTQSFLLIFLATIFFAAVIVITRLYWITFEQRIATIKKQE